MHSIRGLKENRVYYLLRQSQITCAYIFRSLIFRRVQLKRSSRNRVWFYNEELLLKQDQFDVIPLNSSSSS